MKTVEYDEAIVIMTKILEETKDVGVFVDNGWGDDPDSIRTYDIIRDGNGQNPIAAIEKETFDQLMTNGLLSENFLHTFKDRQFYYFQPKR